MKWKPKPLYLTFALMLFTWTSISAARVVLTLDALQLGASASAVGILVATFYVFPLLLSWFIGIFADRVGSRWLLLSGTLAGAVGMLIPVFVDGLPVLFVAATLVGFSFSFYNVLLHNLVGLLSQPHERPQNFSNGGLVGATTNFAGPLLAGFAIDQSGYAVAYLCVMALALIAAALLMFWGDVLPGGSRQSVARKHLRDTLADPGIARILATSSLVQLGQDLFQFYIPIYGHQLQISASAIGAVLAAYAAASFVVRFVMPRLIARLGEERLLAYSFYLAGVGFLLVPFSGGAFTLGVISFVFGLGMGCGQPITTMLIFSHSAAGRSGETLGLRQMVNNLVRVSGPALFGFVASAFGLLPVFWINAVMMGGGGWLARPQDQGTAK
jgi:MFS family permease